uniref:Protein FAR1-RELATED SEQUENCE n=1 Tax=Fagus sylvatica TaxID=28930 RepID=A0A2N9FVB8_FAGSY
MDEVSLNSEPVGDDDADGYEIEGDCAMTEYVGQSGIIQGENPLPPAVGMEFESYDDVYYFYNCYAKEQGFGVRVSNTWYRKSKERYRGKLSCSSAGFKKKSDANRPRPETRTGCPAMIKFRLMDSKRWRIIEVEVEHNHLISPKSGKFYKSHKHLGAGTKRTLQLDSPEEAQKIRLFRTVVIDAEDNGTVDVDEGVLGNNVEYCNQLKLKEGDAQAVLNYFTRLQLMDPNFFYVVDLNEKGCLRNLFWTDARARVAYGYFGDVVAIDTTCLTNKYEVPLVSFVGVNHHGQSVLLGCGLLAGETIESYTWLFRAWLTCMLGRPPQAIITDQFSTLQTAVADVFPRASHCLCLSHIMQKIPEKLGGLFEYEAIEAALNRAVYHSLRSEEFEAAWENMMQHHGIRDQKWLQALYEDRKRWVPVYVKETFLAGMFPAQPSDVVSSFFEGYLNKQTHLKEFLDKYDQALQTKHQLEALEDMNSRNSTYMLKSGSFYDLQLSKLYTNDILGMFKREVEGMYSCFSTRQLNVDGPIYTFIVKDQVEVEGNRRDARDYEVFYNATEMEVLCICGLFNFKGYLCRHALSVLNQNGMEEIPPQYILSRWRKDITRSYVLDHSSNGIDTDNPVHRYDHLYKCVVQVVEEGRKSQDHYKFSLQALDEILNKLHLVEDQPM